MRALIVLTHSECKRLIARGLKELPEIQYALENGRIFVSRGSTTAYVLEELTGEPFEKKYYIAGQMTGDKQNLYRYGSLKGEKRLKEVVLEKGVKREIDSIHEELKKFEPGDIIFKGGNTLGSDGIAGVYMAHPEGGTIGAILPHALARGISIIIPISLSRTIDDSVWELSQILGNQTIDPEYCMGLPIGIMPIPGEIFTELEAFDVLYPDLTVYNIGSGGVGDGEGSLHFFLEGDETDVKSAYAEIVELVKNEETYIPDTE
ncbi:MAG: hypothetical protein KGD64_11315 [Candidatus Heimdallarchaeota archaeon]|nr:hypothetical protein [Candidatus Heimdallarchaeota archaeon]